MVCERMRRVNLVLYSRGLSSTPERNVSFDQMADGVVDPIAVNFKRPALDAHDNTRRLQAPVQSSTIRLSQLLIRQPQAWCM